ncbi:Gfo/Idh/MocA family protein [Candidatus Thioglobus autotrophicus]|uniref:Gfo/Idh/MocA family protein n=1 Tax=Candidatus Thioglobus autotrophicus TaxID=1705394 RepID=UPI00299DDCAD|nr:Gfo/Idh/MocA family oxidoreductase [Candidatus Thioglobus autotrophicus]WPE17745.1 Gfo/Idh/MocA family oxidoreductase [Candidatus Thioglobus autotrophicus]
MINYNIAIIGCGRVAYHHAESIRQVEGMNLIAVCDLDLDKVEKFAKKYNVDAYVNYFQMLKECPSIDIVVIATPSGMHFEHAVDIIRRNKHVIVEKPTFMTPEQLQDAYKLADNMGVNIYPIFQNRHNKAVSRVKRAIDNNELGKINIVSVRLRWCRPQRYYDLSEWRGTLSHDGGASTNQGIHHIDLLRYLGGEVLRSLAIMKTYEVDIEAEDSMVAVVEYKSGAIGNLEITTAARPNDFEASISIIGSKGLAQIGGIAVNELQVFTPNPKDCQKFSEDFLRVKDHGAVYGYGHTKIYQSIYDALLQDNDYEVSSEDALRTLKLLNSFYSSNEKKKWVSVDSSSSNYLGKENDEISNLYRTVNNNT